MKKLVAGMTFGVVALVLAACGGSVDGGIGNSSGGGGGGGACPPIHCAKGFSAVLADGDRCESCVPQACPAVGFDCQRGYLPGDTDGDGCLDQCVPDGDAGTCKAFLGDCPAGTAPADYDGDGCIDGCKPVACPAVVIDCAPGTTLVDKDGDGCADTCVGIK